MRLPAAFSLIEVLISLTIISFGLLSLLQLQMLSLDYQYEAVLMARAGLIFRDVGIAQIYHLLDDASERSKQVSDNFPQAKYQLEATRKGVSQSLVWQNRRRGNSQLHFMLK